VAKIALGGSHHHGMMGWKHALLYMPKMLHLDVSQAASSPGGQEEVISRGKTQCQEYSCIWPTGIKSTAWIFFFCWFVYCLFETLE
jgi:hypothetical protein